MTALPPFEDVDSLWQATAAKRPTFPELSGDHQFDIAIVGGGYTGLSTARYLARKGLSPVVLEASSIGWGASGRNGGVVSTEYRLDFRDIAKSHGLDAARHMYRIGIEAVEHVSQLIADYDIEEAGYRPTGSLKCAHNSRSLALLSDEVAWLASFLNDRASTILSRDEVVRETGSQGFVGGMLTTHGGVIHPLNYVLGFARGLKSEGIAIFERSPVLERAKTSSHVALRTPNGVVRARQVVLATDGYSQLTPATKPIRNAIIPFRSAIIATRPLTGTPAAHLLCEGRSYTETRRMMRWFRKAGDRLLYGGRGAFGKTDSEAAFDALQRAMVSQFPELREIDVTHRWSGLVSMTLDSVPHLGRLDDRTVYSIGYNGAGVAMSSYIGLHVADLVTGGKPDLGLITGNPLERVPLYFIKEPAVRLVAGWYQFLDAIGR